MPSAHGQKFQPKTIQFNGAPEYSTEELLAAAELKKGAVLNYAEMNEHSKKLMDTGMFATLAFKFDGVDLIFSITQADGLLKARYDNIPLGSDEEITAALHKQFPLFHGLVPTENGYAEAVRAALEQMLAERKLPAAVLATPAAPTRSRATATLMSYTISAPRVFAGPVTVRGASLEWTPKANDIAAADDTASYDAANSSSNIERSFTDFYLDHGYAAAHATARQAGDATIDDNGIHVPFAVTISEGKHYQIGAIQLPAGTPITQPEVDKILAERPGAPEPGVRLRSLWLAVAQRFKAKGYLDVKLTPQPVFDDAAGKVNYAITIETGPVYHLAFVKFEGASDELRAMLIKNWQMMPGDPFNESYVASFITNVQVHDPVLQRTLVGVHITNSYIADPQSHDVNVVIRLSK
ncbi:MAG TPA: hypothetical protein VN151_06310 [Terracidiphilus sp.]|nr:hypothetical protein [Terracidiphilus sp.]